MKPFTSLRPKKILNTNLLKYSTTSNVSRDAYYNKFLQEDTSKPKDWDAAKPFHLIPGPRGFPFLGVLPNFLPLGPYYKMPLLDAMKKIGEDYGDIVFLKGPKKSEDMVMLYNPEDFDAFLKIDKVWPKRDLFPIIAEYKTKIRKDIFKESPGLLSINGEEWFKLRTIVNPIVMQPNNALSYIESIDAITNEFIDNVKYFASLNPEGEMPADFLNEINKWTLESISRIVLDRRMGALSRHLDKNSVSFKYLDIIMKLIDFMFKLEMHPMRAMYFFKKREYIKTLDELTKITLQFIDEALESIKKEPNIEHNQSVLRKLLEINPQYAFVMAMDLTSAGVDTTGKIFGAALYFLSRFKDKQDRLREEIKNLLPLKNSVVTREVLENAPYLKATIKETTRLAPIGIGHLRTVQKDLVIRGYQIPKGTKVTSQHLLASISDKYVKKGKDFIPERWLRTERSDLGVDPMLVLPFGFGPRSCIGKRLSSMELEVGLAKMVRNFEMSWPHPDMQFDMELLYGIKDPLKIHMKPLEN